MPKHISHSPLTKTRVSGGFVGGYLPKSRPNDFVNASRCAAMQGTHGSAPTTSSRVVVSVVKSMTSETRDGTSPSPDRKTRMNNERRPGPTVRVITLSKNGRRYVWTRSCGGPRLIDSQEFHSFIHAMFSGEKLNLKLYTTALLFPPPVRCPLKRGGRMCGFLSNLAPLRARQTFQNTFSCRKETPQPPS